MSIEEHDKEEGEGIEKSKGYIRTMEGEQLRLIQCKGQYRLRQG
jgi:hypothetical protein